MNAVTLSILVHHYYKSDRYPSPTEAPSKSVEDGYLYLIRNDLLCADQPYPTLTERGRCHVEALLNAPLPTATWVSPIIRALP